MSTALRNHPKSCINRFNASVPANWAGATGTGRSRLEIPWDGGDRAMTSTSLSATSFVQWLEDVGERRR